MSGLGHEKIRRYHVFLASPGDMDDERKIVRQFFTKYNTNTAWHRHLEFIVVDWETRSTAGVGDGQALITEQVLERYRKSLALVVGLMGQRFGSPTNRAESGTYEEFMWALRKNRKSGWPEIKWFFKKGHPPHSGDPVTKALDQEQWDKVRDFRTQLCSDPQSQLYVRDFDDTEFEDVLERDLRNWLEDSARPWNRANRVWKALAQLILFSIVCAMLLATLFYRLCARAYLPPTEAPDVVLITLDDDSKTSMESGRLSNLGYESDDVTSLRVVFAELLGALAECRPRVVVFDYWFQKHRPEYDSQFADGVRKYGGPVIIGVWKLEADGRPSMPPAFSDAGVRYGHMVTTKPDTRMDEYIVPICLKRRVEGGEVLVPSLGLEALMASRDPYKRAKWGVTNTAIDIAYSGGLAERLEVSDIVIARRAFHGLWPGDQLYNVQVQKGAADAWRKRSLSLDDCLREDCRQLKERVRDQIVVIGSTVSGSDQYVDLQGETVFGCEIMAQLIDQLAHRAVARRYSMLDLFGRFLFWSALAWAIGRLLPMSRLRARRAATCAFLFIAAGLVFGGSIVLSNTSRMELETVIGSSGLVIGVGLAVAWTASTQHWRRAADSSR